MEMRWVVVFVDGLMPGIEEEADDFVGSCREANAPVLL
jgi:hypothetical protein